MTNDKETPWHDDDFVYFELQSPEFEAFEGTNEGGTYVVPDFSPGTYRLAIDAIREATPQERQSKRDQLISVDACQIFFVDKSRVARFRDRFNATEGLWPNYPYFETLRREIGVDFGFAAVTADGVYVLDLAELERLKQEGKTATKRATPGNVDLYEKVARRMGTFVCERCYAEELMEPSGAGPVELARLAKQQGWLLLPPAEKRESWFFEAFQVVGPKCAAKPSPD
jgi:hypothetical protein